jgi:hypothetical protein
LASRASVPIKEGPTTKDLGEHSTRIDTGSRKVLRLNLAWPALQIQNVAELMFTYGWTVRSSDYYLISKL